MGKTDSAGKAEPRVVKISPSLEKIVEERLFVVFCLPTAPVQASQEKIGKKKKSTLLILNAQAKKLNLSKLASMVLCLLCLTPFLKGDLYILVRLDRDKVAVLISISQPHRTSGNRVVGESANLRIDSVDKGLVCDVEGHHKCNVISVAVHLDLKLSWECYVVTRHL